MQLPEKWNGMTISHVPMGQGVAVSPLQLATAYSAIANDGVLVQPHLVKDALQPWSRRWSARPSPLNCGRCCR